MKKLHTQNLVERSGDNFKKLQETVRQLDEDRNILTRSTGSVVEWVEHTLNRAKMLDSMAKEARLEKNVENSVRLSCKAGCFRSLAMEVKQILSQNVEN